MARLATPKTEFHTLHLRSRILGEVIKELKLDELRVTTLVISADKTIAKTQETLPIPELEKYFQGKTLLRRRQMKDRLIHRLPLRVRDKEIVDIDRKKLTSNDGIDLEYVNKILTKPPYGFPYVRVEEFEAQILKTEEPEEVAEIGKVPKEAVREGEPKKSVRIPKKIKFKRTIVKQANIVSTLKPQPHAGAKYTLELVTTRKKDAVQRIREIIALNDPIKICELVMKNEMVTICREILGKEQ